MQLEYARRSSDRARRIALGVAALSVSLAVAASAPLKNYYVPADRLPWKLESPNMPVRLAALWGDRTKGEAGTLLNVPGGFKAPLHSHTADYWAVVVEGEWRHWVPSTGEGVGVVLKPGAHWTQIHTQPHEDACVSTVPCTIMLFNKEPYQTEFVQQGARL